MWTVVEHPDFSEERKKLPPVVLEKLAEVILTLEAVGPSLGRPLVDTLKASRHANMKEMRFAAGGVWRVAFAFDQTRHAVVLVGGNKQSRDQKKFYQDLIRVADDRFDDWLNAGE
ncbi:MAG: type II toxin-antitoxin system RelE/ParE family toxin [Devosia sp.]|nr:type II toxin-antitoxin system RelE/ParE family toxin [Devosia sp.]